MIEFGKGSINALRAVKSHSPSAAPNTHVLAAPRSSCSVFFFLVKVPCHTIEFDAEDPSLHVNHCVLKNIDPFGQGPALASLEFLTKDLLD